MSIKQGHNIPHMIVHVIDLMGDAGVYDVGNQQDWDSQPHRYLGGLCRRHAKGTPSGQIANRKASMNQ